MPLILHYNLLPWTCFIVRPKSIDLFNGKDLSGWIGKDQFWRVENATIIGETTAENPTPANTFLIWKGGEVRDFEFSCQVKFQEITPEFSTAAKRWVT